MKPQKIHKIRRTLYPFIHRKKERIGDNLDTKLYAKYTMYYREYITTLDISVNEAYDLMEDLGFQYEPIAALKIWEPTGKIEDGSFVRREGGYASSDPYQLHIHIFEEPDGGVTFAGHYEYSWIRHPYKHYRAHKMEYDTAKDMVTELIEDSDYAGRANDLRSD